MSRASRTRKPPFRALKGSMPNSDWWIRKLATTASVSSLPEHGRAEAQVAHRAPQRDACRDRRIPGWTGKCDRLDPDDRIRRRVEDVPAEHVLARVAARGLRDLRREFVAFLGSRRRRIHGEGIHWNLEPEAARRRGVAGPDLALHAGDDDVVVAEARERPVTVNEETDFGPLWIDGVARRAGGNPPPELPGSMPRWERRAALATHRLFYLLLILAPLAGWLYASAAGLSVNWFDLFQVPDLVSKDRQLAELFKALHIGLAALLASLVAVHVGAALRHGFLLRDDVTHRMLPWKPRRND